MGGGGGRGLESLFIKNLAHYTSHSNFGLFIKMRPIIHYKKERWQSGKEI